MIVCIRAWLVTLPTHGNPRLRLYIEKPRSPWLSSKEGAMKTMIKRDDPVSNEWNGFKPRGVRNDFIEQDGYRTDQLQIQNERHAKTRQTRKKGGKVSRRAETGSKSKQHSKEEAKGRKRRNRTNRHDIEHAKDAITGECRLLKQTSIVIQSIRERPGNKVLTQSSKEKGPKQRKYIEYGESGAT